MTEKPVEPSISVADLIIREFTDADSEGTRAVAQDAHSHLRKVYRPSVTAKKIGSDVPFVRLIAIVDDSVVGTLTYEIEDDALYFGSLGVLEIWRRKGVTSRFIHYLENVATNMGLSKLTCATVEETGNVEIFEKLGFQPTDRKADGKFEGMDGKTVHEVRLAKEIAIEEALVRANYDVIYTDPIKVKRGDIVTIERWETDPEWLGWAWCVGLDGKAGWISNRYFEAEGSKAVMLRDYEATELAVRTGEHLKLYYQEAGWAWCKNARGLKGWVPCRNLVFE